MNQVTTTRRRPAARSWFEDLFDDFFAPVTRGDLGSRAAIPAMNVSETADAFELEFELPGIAEEDIRVNYDGNQLVVNAERKFESEKREGTDFHRIEHRYGSFTRSITLPKEVDADKIEAAYSRGVLKVRVPKSEPSKARKIEIKSQ